MAYHGDVKFLEDCNPALIDRNADEFKRMRDLLDSIEPSVTKAKDVQWESAATESYEARLGEVKGLVDGLRTGFNKARSALMHYADAVRDAKRHLEDGLHAEKRLSDLMKSVGAVAVTRTAQKAEPMVRWEDLRKTTGVLDWAAELLIDVDEIRDDANRAYDQADEAFGRAESTEEHAREDCVAKLKAAYEAIPDFRGGHFRDAKDMIDSIPELSTEAQQAAANPYAHLPGTGVKGDVFPAAGDKDVSPALERIRELLKHLPEGKGNYLLDALPGGALRWVENNKELIKAAAKEAGIPADLFAAIAIKEVGGKPYFLDDATEKLRNLPEHDWFPLEPGNLPGSLGKKPDETSYGPLAVQIRRAAEVLGYNPHDLTDDQRDEIRSALKDPAQNIFIAAEYLGNLKAESSTLADVPPDQMTPEQYQELAARYNAGPEWDSDDGREYSEYIADHLDDARQALK